MSIILPLSTLPAERLKAQSDSGLFPWDDPDAAMPSVEEACADSGGDSEREAELIMLALRENVPTAIRRAIDRNPEVRMERCLRQVAEYYGALAHISARINPIEARWSVDTLAAMANLIPSSEVGATASMPKAPPRPTATPPVTGPSSQPSWAATQAEPSLPPWVQASSNGAVAPPAPAAANATTSLPAPPGTGLAAGAGVTLERGGVAPGAWPPSPGSGLGGRASFGLGASDSGVPPEVEQGKWSWAGLLGGWLWMISHRLWVPAIGWLVLSFACNLLPHTFGIIARLALWIGISIYMGLNGNRLAWTHRSFNSVEQFRSVQRAWTTFGVVIVSFDAVLLVFVAIAAYYAAHGRPLIPYH